MAKKEELYFKTHASKIWEDARVGEVNMVFELVNPRLQDHKHIKGKARIPYGREIHNIRYNSGFSSPFVDEQKSDIPIEVKGLTFKERVIYAPSTDPCMQKFLLLHPWNKANGGKLFELRDEQAKRDERLKGKRARRQATKLLDDNMTLEALYPVAFVLQPTNVAIADMDIRELEELIELAIDKDPQKVIDAFHDDEAELIYHFNRAASEGILTINNHEMKVVWSETGGKLFDIPKGIPAWRRWIGFVATHEGQTVYDLLKEQLDND